VLLLGQPPQGCTARLSTYPPDISASFPQHHEPDLHISKFYNSILFNTAAMESKEKGSASALFQVFLRLRPPLVTGKTNLATASLYPQLPIETPAERYLIVEPPEEGESEDRLHKHITVNPPTESRRRAVEKYTFTNIFQEEATQLDLFHGTGLVPLIEGVLGKEGGLGRDGLVATLGVTGSGKTHTILGSRSQRGLTQMSLDLLYKALHGSIVQPSQDRDLQASLSMNDASEASVIMAANLFDTPSTEHYDRGAGASRAGTPVASTVSQQPAQKVKSTISANMFLYPSLSSVDSKSHAKYLSLTSRFKAPHIITRSIAKTLCSKKETQQNNPTRRHVLHNVANMPTTPSTNEIPIEKDERAEYAILVSMYEVYNDRIFDLLSSQQASGMSFAKSMAQKDKRRPLLFKSTEKSLDRKVVAGLRKVICSNLKEAYTVLEAGLLERRTTGTGSNAVSSRSHGFFCVEVLKRPQDASRDWAGSVLTIVDLAGSERARNAKTAGATLAEAGKINESLMYLGQCLQMQSDNSMDGIKPSLVPFRQCKLTELLFSNSFPSASAVIPSHHHRNPQKAVMIVTADPVGDFNATSQILRYSALAREITVPRIPSVTSLVFGHPATVRPSSSGSGSGPAHQRSTSTSSADALSQEELIVAAEEIARLTEELDTATIRLTESETQRIEAETKWIAAEQRCAAIEEEVRDECWSAFEEKLLEERQRWTVAYETQLEQGEHHLDRKVELLAGGLAAAPVMMSTPGRDVEVFEDDHDSEQQARIADLEDENDELRRELELMKRELLAASPTKKRTTRSSAALGSSQFRSTRSSVRLTGSGPLSPLSGSSRLSNRLASGSSNASTLAESVTSTDSENPFDAKKITSMMERVTIEEENDTTVLAHAESPIKGARTPSTGSPSKKMRKLTARKWEEAVLSPADE
jgi:hypothetical protein